MPEKEYFKKNSSSHSKGSPESLNKYSVGGYNSQNESHAAFAAMVNLLDDQVGQIIDKVHELGIAEKTLIIFSSDDCFDILVFIFDLLYEYYNKLQLMT